MSDSNLVPVRRALISVSDKSGIVDFAHGLVGQGVELLSTGGTYRMLQENGLPITPENVFIASAAARTMRLWQSTASMRSIWLS